MILKKYKIKKNIKKYKLISFQKIINDYNQIYLFRYTNLNINDILLLKKNIKNVNFNLLFLKKKLFFPFHKQKGSLLLIFGNNLNFILDKKLITKKLHLISINYLDSFYLFNKKVSNISNIFSNKPYLLNKILMNNFLLLMYCLRQI